MDIYSLGSVTAGHELYDRWGWCSWLKRRWERRNQSGLQGVHAAKRWRLMQKTPPGTTMSNNKNKGIFLYTWHWIMGQFSRNSFALRGCRGMVASAYKQNDHLSLRASVYSWIRSAAELRLGLLPSFLLYFLCVATESMQFALSILPDLMNVRLTFDPPSPQRKM